MREGIRGLGFIGRVYGDLIRIYPKPYSIYFTGTIGLLFRGWFGDWHLGRRILELLLAEVLCGSWEFRFF